MVLAKMLLKPFKIIWETDIKEKKWGTDLVAGVKSFSWVTQGSVLKNHLIYVTEKIDICKSANYTTYYAYHSSLILWFED